MKRLLSAMGRYWRRRRERSRRLWEWTEEAALPYQSADRLAEIYDQAHKELRSCFFPPQQWRPLWEVLAWHANTPPDVFGQVLCAGHEAAFCRNPVAPLLPLSDPDLIREWPDTAVKRVLTQPHAPASLIGLLTGDADPIRAQEARLHIALAEEGEEARWRSDVVTLIRWLVRRAGNAERTLLWELAGYGLLPRWVGPPDLPHIPEETTSADPPLWTEEGIALREHRALNRPDGQGGVEWQFLGQVRQFAATVRNPEASPEQLITLAGRDRWLCEAVANNPGSSREVLEKLLDLYLMDESAREAIARHPNADAALLRIVVAQSCEPRTRRVAMAHPASPVGLGLLCQRRTLDCCHRLGGQHEMIATALFAGISEEDKKHWHRYRRDSWLSRLTEVLGKQGEDTRLLNNLTGDANRLIRAAARARLAGEYRPADLFASDFGGPEQAALPAVQ